MDKSSILKRVAEFVRNREGDISCEMRIGVRRFVQDGWMCAEPNGTATVTVTIDGGAIDTGIDLSDLRWEIQR